MSETDLIRQAWNKAPCIYAQKLIKDVANYHAKLGELIFLIDFV